MMGQISAGNVIANDGTRPMPKATRDSNENGPARLALEASVGADITATELQMPVEQVVAHDASFGMLAEAPVRQIADQIKPGRVARPLGLKKELAGNALHAPEAMRSHQDALLGAVAPMMDMEVRQDYREQGRDRFSNTEPNETKLVAENPVTAFSIDVDTASYSFLRASLHNNTLPQSNAVRIEELINYFPYDYRAPQDKTEPFRAHVSVLPTPWNKATKLLHIGIKGYEHTSTEQKKSNLVFLIDSSGSMNATNKLPLLRNAFKLLLSTLNPSDTIAILTYAGSAGTLLEPTVVSDQHKIIAALDSLRSGGSTAGGEGIRQAYQLAEQNYDDSAVNRVILATDGDFNVGIRDPQELKSYIERKRESGVYLSVLGFGMGNYNDEFMKSHRRMPRRN